MYNIHLKSEVIMHLLCVLFAALYTYCRIVQNRTMVEKNQPENARDCPYDAQNKVIISWANVYSFLIKIF